MNKVAEDLTKYNANLQFQFVLSSAYEAIEIPFNDWWSFEISNLNSRGERIPPGNPPFNAS